MIPFDPGEATPTDLPVPTTAQTLGRGVSSGLEDTSIGMLWGLGREYKPDETLDQDQFKSSTYYRDGLNWSQGMTAAMAKAAANKYDAEQAGLDAAYHPGARIAGQFVGGALDPLFYIPYADIGAAALRAGRTALELDALSTISKEASIGRMLDLPNFNPETVLKSATRANPVLRGAEIQALNATGASVLEQPLVAMQDRNNGENYDWQRAGFSVATAFLSGGFFGGLGATLGKLTMDQRTLGIAKAAEDLAMGRPVETGSAVKPAPDLTKQVQEILSKGGIPDADPRTMSDNALRAIKIASHVSPEMPPVEGEPKVGEPFIAYRLGSSNQLQGRNGGNAEGVANYISSTEDFEKAAQSNATHVHAYKVTPEEKFGEYVPGTGGEISKGLGRDVQGKNSVIYSFGSGFKAEHLGAVPVEDLRNTIAERFKSEGYHTFDEIGTGNGADIIREAFGHAPLSADDRAFLESFKKDGGASYYQEKLDELNRLEGMARMPGLSESDRAVESRFRDKIIGDLEGAKTAYKALNNTELGLSSEGGKILNTDLARELSPDYAASKDARSRLAPAVHEPASALIKELYRERLAEPPGPGEDPLVLFMSGGSGAGKSSAIEEVAATRRLASRAQIIYDTNSNHEASAVEKIEQAREAGKKVVVVHVARDIVEAQNRGTLPRAMRVGRTVVMPEHIKTHTGSAETIQKLAERYKNDPDVKVMAIDNTGSKGTQRVVPVSFVKKLDYNGSEGRLKAALDAEHENGKISDAVYYGTLGKPVPGSGVGRAEQAPAGSEGGAAEPPVPGGVQSLHETDGSGSLSKLERARAWLTTQLGAIKNPTPDWRSLYPLSAHPETPDISGLPLTEAEKDYAAKGDDIASRAAGMAKAMQAGAACYGV